MCYASVRVFVFGCGVCACEYSPKPMWEEWPCFTQHSGEHKSLFKTNMRGQHDDSAGKGESHSLAGKPIGTLVGTLVYPVLPALHILVLKIESWPHLQQKLSWPCEPEASP